MGGGKEEERVRAMEPRDGGRTDKYLVSMDGWYVRSGPARHGMDGWMGDGTGWDGGEVSTHYEGKGCAMEEEARPRRPLPPSRALPCPVLSGLG